MTSEEIDQEKVNQILLGDGSLEDLKPFFPNQEAILNFHAQRMAELFPPNTKKDECESCHRHSAEFQTQFEWRGLYTTVKIAFAGMIGTAVATAFTHHLFHFLMPAKQIEFSTTHSFCGNCFKQIRRRRMFAFFVNQLCLALVVIAAVIFTAVIIFTIFFLFPQPTKSAIAYAAIGSCGGLLCLAGGLLGGDRIVRWCLPRSLEFISKPPFQLVGFIKY
jgi:hypothetical protein